MPANSRWDLIRRLRVKEGKPNGLIQATNDSDLQCDVGFESHSEHND